MKKIVFTLALLAGVAGAARAQDVSLGLKAGPTYSSFVGTQAPNQTYVFGFHAGGFANIGLTKLFAFQPEVLYSQKGSDLGVVDFRLHYLDVPLAFHVNADGLFFEAGPQVGFLLAAKAKTGNTSTDIRSSYNTVDFGYLAGLGYQRKTGLGIGLRYNGGFTNIEKSFTVGNVTVQNNIRNSAFQLYLTYSFGG
ncbi:porin family protein [Hymenobacter convexus]|uniref:porin family protein n=1 Tax=Hymenobacter sp. CA1UV-4 TaxID=3063782 RepID=UPI002713D1A7|nr:porin family protein [Hymenobacter sp. CA1UV-4]MDO7854018.1 porin family protein [Hymenobacter sp. CA1UV-4]